MALFEAVGDVDCLLHFENESYPFLDAGDELLICDGGLPDSEVRRLGGGSEEKPERFNCHARNFGEAELPRLGFLGGMLLPLNGWTLDPVFFLWTVGEEHLGTGDKGLFEGVDGLRDGVVGRKTGDGLEQGADDGLPLD